MKCKLSDADLYELEFLYQQAGWTQTDLANAFGVSRRTVYRSLKKLGHL